MNQLKIASQAQTQETANLPQDGIACPASQRLVDLRKAPQREADEQKLLFRGAQFRKPVETEGECHHSGGRVNLRFVVQRYHGSGKEQRLRLVLIPFHNPTAVNPDRIAMLVVHPVTDVMQGSFFLQHLARFLRMERPILLHQALFEQRHEIIHQVA